MGAIVTEDDIVTRAAVCRWAAEPPVLDGKLDDRCWQRAAVIDRFGSFWTNPKKSISGTFAYLVWDDDALYYAGSMTDAELRSFGTKRNDHLWNGDVFELFLKPSAGAPEYYEFQANPRGVVFEAPFPKRGHDFGGFSNASDGEQGRRRFERDARPTRRPRRGLERGRSHPLVGLRTQRRQAEARRRVAFRDLPL